MKKQFNRLLGNWIRGSAATSKTLLRQSVLLVLFFLVWASTAQAQVSNGITVNVVAAGTSDATAGNVTFNVAVASTYTYNVVGFAAGDQLVFPIGTAISITNVSTTDGVVDVIGSLNAQSVSVTVHLTGIALASDSQIFNPASFNTTFGAGSISFGAPTTTAPTCTLTASPATVTAGVSSTLTASCTGATSYTWMGGTCVGDTVATCTVNPTATTTYSVTGNYAGGTSAAATATVTVQPTATQTIGAINFSPATLTVGGTGTASATATSGLAVSFSSTTPNVCTVSGSNLVSVAAGTCTIAANQAGNASYSAAPQVTQSIQVTTLTCTSPQVLQNGVCVTPTLTCTSPQVLQNGVCVTPTPTCYSPQVLQNGVCVTPTPTISNVLSVAKSGNGSGTVTSGDGSIDCVSTCSGSFASATPVTLTATPASGSTFAGWSGDCTGTGSCVVTINAAKNVTAIFVPIGFTLNVNSSGAPNVQIGSSPASYAGATSYSMTGIASGTSITLTAPEKSGNASFGRWSGCDSSSGLTCTVSMNAAKSVTASYAATPYTLSVTPGNGTVTSGDGSINCGSTCSASFTSGASVTLTATPAKDYLFDGWNGCDTSTKTNDSTGTCTVSIDSLRTVQPLFHYAAAVHAVTQGTNADGTITAPVATVITNISFNPPDVGKTVSVYVTALVPARLFAPPAAKQSAAGSVRAMAATASNASVLVQLTSSGWQPVVNGQMIPYTTGVLGDQISAITILNNTDTANLGGTQICVGYGTSASEMTSAGRMQRVATIPDPNAANTNTGSCNVTIPISDARVFAFAEAKYANFFTGTATSGQYQQYNYQYYSSKQNYLAVDTSGVVWVSGPDFNQSNEPIRVDPVESFRSAITTWEGAQ